MPNPKKKKSLKTRAQQTKLQKLLVKKNMSQDDLADLWGKKKSYVSVVCNGHVKMNEVSIAELCMLLEVTPNDILPWEEWRKLAKEMNKKKS